MGDVPKVKPRSRRDIAAIASGLLLAIEPKRLQVPGRLNVLELWEQLRDRYGLDIHVAELPEGVEGITWPTGKIELDVKTYVGAINGIGRCRFTICHEGAHGILHVGQLPTCSVELTNQTLYRRGQIKPYENPEWQADEFAGALLMPQEMVAKVVRGVSAGTAAAKMHDVFGVSVPAAETRLRILREVLGMM